MPTDLTRDEGWGPARDAGLRAVAQVAHGFGSEEEIAPRKTCVALIRGRQFGVT